MVLKPSDSLTPSMFSPPAVCCVPPGMMLGLSRGAAGAKLSYFLPAWRALESLDATTSVVDSGVCLVSSAMVLLMLLRQLWEFYDRMRRPGPSGDLARSSPMISVCLAAIGRTRNASTRLELASRINQSRDSPRRGSPLCPPDNTSLPQPIPTPAFYALLFGGFPML